MNSQANASTSSSQIKVQEYSERSFVVCGNTKEIKDNLKELGGKYNSRLKDSVNKDATFSGWIFPKSKYPFVREWLEANHGDSLVYEFIPVNNSDNTTSHNKQEKTQGNDLSDQVQRLTERMVTMEKTLEFLFNLIQEEQPEFREKINQKMSAKNVNTEINRKFRELGYEK